MGKVAPADILNITNKRWTPFWIGRPFICILKTFNNFFKKQRLPTTLFEKSNLQQFVQIHLFLQNPGKLAQQWDKWYDSFENFLIAIDTDKFNTKRKRAILYSNLGLEGQEVFTSLPEISSVGQGEGWNEYQEAITRLKNTFSEQPNILLERFNFNKRNQLTYESVEEYISALRILATKCNFGPSIDISIRDQFVFGCNAKKIQERLLSYRDPTLSEVIDMAKAIERSILSSKCISSDTNFQPLNNVNNIVTPEVFVLQI